MTKDGWDSKWPSGSPVFIGWDKGTDDKTTIVNIADDKVAYIGELKSQGSNLMDEQAYLYFQCEGCQKMLKLKLSVDKLSHIGQCLNDKMEK